MVLSPALRITRRLVLICATVCVVASGIDQSRNAPENTGKPCWSACGRKQGWCSSYCGDGALCCRYNVVNDPVTGISNGCNGHLGESDASKQGYHQHVCVSKSQAASVAANIRNQTACAGANVRQHISAFLGTPGVALGAILHKFGAGQCLGRGPLKLSQRNRYIAESLGSQRTAAWEALVNVSGSNPQHPSMCHKEDTQTIIFWLNHDNDVLNRTGSYQMKVSFTLEKGVWCWIKASGAGHNCCTEKLCTLSSVQFDGTFSPHGSSQYTEEEIEDLQTAVSGLSNLSLSNQRMNRKALEVMAPFCSSF